MATVQELPRLERPREKAERYGIRSLSNRELLAVILRSGIQGQSALETADRLLMHCGGIVGLARCNTKELMQIKGIREVKAIELQACFEISRRISRDGAMDKDVISSPDTLICWLQHELGSELQEQFMAVYLDAANQIVHYKVLFVGTLDSSMVFPREIFKEALLCNSSRIMLVHNHPSGVLSPSDADILMTHRIQRIGILMEVEILDHIIVSQRDFFSFRGAGILDQRHPQTPNP